MEYAHYFDLAGSRTIKQQMAADHQAPYSRQEPVTHRAYFGVEKELPKLLLDAGEIVLCAYRSPVQAPVQKNIPQIITR